MLNGDRISYFFLAEARDLRIHIDDKSMLESYGKFSGVQGYLTGPLRLAEYNLRHNGHHPAPCSQAATIEDLC